MFHLRGWVLPLSKRVSSALPWFCGLWIPKAVLEKEAWTCVPAYRDGASEWPQ